MKKEIQAIFDKWISENDFSGVFTVSDSEGIIFQKACGYRNRGKHFSIINGSVCQIWII